jgi:hypothetical protein
MVAGAIDDGNDAGLEFGISFRARGWERCVMDP